jgi:hypothetical protein
MLVLLLQQLQDTLELLEVVHNPKVELILEVFKVLKLYLDKV